MTELTQDTLKSLFLYDAETGDLIWRHRPRGMFPAEQPWKTWNTRYAGKVACNMSSDGYVRVNVFGKRYMAHRLIWMMHHGCWPEEIDHINGNRKDNRLVNLRAVDRAENMRNVARRSDNTTGHTGVSYSKRDGVFIAYITLGGVMKVIGRFATADEAAAARAEWQDRHGYHPNHGRAA